MLCGRWCALQRTPGRLPVTTQVEQPGQITHPGRVRLLPGSGLENRPHGDQQGLPCPLLADAKQPLGGGQLRPRQIGGIRPCIAQADVLDQLVPRGKNPLRGFLLEGELIHESRGQGFAPAVDVGWYIVAAACTAEIADGLESFPADPWRITHSRHQAGQALGITRPHHFQAAVGMDAYIQSTGLAGQGAQEAGGCVQARDRDCTRVRQALHMVYAHIDIGPQQLQPAADALRAGHQQPGPRPGDPVRLEHGRRSAPGRASAWCRSPGASPASSQCGSASPS